MLSIMGILWIRNLIVKSNPIESMDQFQSDFLNVRKSPRIRKKIALTNFFMAIQASHYPIKLNPLQDAFVYMKKYFSSICKMMSYEFGLETLISFLKKFYFK